MREGRKARGWTQEEMAGRIGMATQSLSNVERGQALPSLETLARIAEVLEMPISWFLPSDVKGKSEQRLALDARISTLVAALDDREAEVAAGLLAVLLRVYSRSGG
ncbi:DNA-binding protein [Skermanella stibiiresistens SB22]|uniref:DNA-binding protein n=1 Tax=Skermanella stibiiresistens SB22 TaxID=1385369 RepID=W9H0J7_9PROT|nr:DNA-binding protein [Skermanella stibiiresistens SB22]